MAHSWFVKTINEEYIPPAALEVQHVVDLTVVYSITKAIPEWTAKKIISSLNNQRHNQITATYYLMSEKLRKTN